MTRLTARFWVDAYLARLRFADIPAFVVSHGDDTAGAVLVKANPLDGRATREIEEILTEVAASGTRLIMSTHNMGQAQRLADEVLFVLHGKVAEFSPAEAFFAGPQTDQARAFLNGAIVE